METDPCPNCFLLPAGILAEEVTVGLFKSLLEPSGSPLGGSPGPPIGAPYHLRFKAPCPSSPSGFVWIDEPPEDEPVPTCNSSRGSCVVCKALLLPVGVLPKEAAAAQAVASAIAAAEDGGRKQRSAASTQSPQTPQQEQHFVASDHNVSSGSEGPADVSGAAAAGDQVGGSWGPSPDWIVNDILTEEPRGGSAEPLGVVHSRLAKTRSAPGGCLQEDDLYHYEAASGPPAGEAVLRRAELAANREAKKQQRMMEKLQEVERRRAQEVKQQLDKLALPEELKQELDRWSKTADGSFKDVRTLLSTLHEVLWEDAPWEPASLSSLMMPQTLKKHFRRALLLAHPDKHQNASPSRQYRAERIFQALNESFKTVSS